MIIFKDLLLECNDKKKFVNVFQHLQIFFTLKNWFVHGRCILYRNINCSSYSTTTTIQTTTGYTHEGSGNNQERCKRRKTTTTTIQTTIGYTYEGCGDNQ